MKPIADEVAPFLTLLQGKTDEEWAAHDAKVAAELARENGDTAKRERADKRSRYVDHGFNLRAIEAAESADESALAVQRVARWQCATENVLVLSGPPGCGKTVAATWWALRLPSGMPRFLRATAFAASSRYERESRELVLQASALVLDDLGTEYADAKGNFLVDLDELIDTYYGSRRPLLITTNLKLEEFKTKYGARVEDRIRECGAWYSVSSTSLRRRA